MTPEQFQSINMQIRAAQIATQESLEAIIAANRELRELAQLVAEHYIKQYRDS